MEPIIDRIRITVRDMAAAIAFCDRLLPLPGFSPRSRSSAIIEEHDFHGIEYSHPRLSFAITSPRTPFRDESVHRRRPGSLHHLAFRAASREEVDRLHGDPVAIGATVVTPPRLYPEYKPAGCYAVFFKDPDGIEYEIVTHDGVGRR
jgi:catechol 2,3-dioxygenase-like lactoylglutathione lyase family enzyme